jgi:hypothetical protein
LVMGHTPCQIEWNSTVFCAFDLYTVLQSFVLWPLKIVKYFWSSILLGLQLVSRRQMLQYKLILYLVAYSHSFWNTWLEVRV